MMMTMMNGIGIGGGIGGGGSSGPNGLQSHQKTLYLAFSPKCLPYAEVAQFIIHSNTPNTDTNTTHLGTHQPKLRLELGVQQDLLSRSPTLFIPKGLYSDRKQVITGKPSILRFFSRLNAQPPTTAVDALIEKLRLTSSIRDPELLSSLDSFTLDYSKINIADVWAWDYMMASGHQNSYSRALNELDELQEAKRLVDEILDRVPVIDYYKYKVIEQIASLTNLSTTFISQSIVTTKVKTNGDLAIPIPKLGIKGDAKEIASLLASKYRTCPLIIQATSSGAFLYFHYNSTLLHHEALKQAVKLGAEYGNNYTGLGKFAVCEYSSPNIAKPFHAGNLRSTILGSFIQKLLSACAWKTVSINYLGDWGKQYGLLAIGFNAYGSSTTLAIDPIKHLYEVYVKINADAGEDESVHDQARAYFKKMEDGDEEALALWQKFRDLSIIAYKKIYSRLNIEFDVYSGESQYSLKQMHECLDELKSKDLLTPDAGAMVVDLKEYDLGTAVIAKSDGSMLYLSRDIAAAVDRYKTYDFDKMIYVVGTPQSHHFNQLFKILGLMGKNWVGRCEHIGFGLIKSKDGNMSTRAGTVVFLSDILDNVREEMHGVMKKNEKKYAMIQDPDHVADIVGISSIFIQDMGARRVKDYAFDWARMLSFEGDTGPYLQFAHARLCSIERLADFKVTGASIEGVDLGLLIEPQAAAVLDLVVAFPDVIRDISTTLEPCQLVNYSLRLAHAVSSAITELWVQGREPGVARARLGMYSAARICLGNSLKILGLEALERM